MAGRRRRRRARRWGRCARPGRWPQSERGRTRRRRISPRAAIALVHEAALTSAPITSTLSARRLSTCAAASESATGNRLHAAPQSIVPAPWAPARRPPASAVGVSLSAAGRPRAPCQTRPAYIGVLEPQAPRGDREVGQALALAHVATLADARAGEDPLLGHSAPSHRGVADHVVGKAIATDARAAARDRRPPQDGRVACAAAKGSGAAASRTTALAPGTAADSAGNPSSATGGLPCPGEEDTRLATALRTSGLQGGFGLDAVEVCVQAGRIARVRSPRMGCAALVSARRIGSTAPAGDASTS